MTKLVSIFILLAAAFTLAASAPGIESSGEQIVTTRHQIKVGHRRDYGNIGQSSHCPACLEG